MSCFLGIAGGFQFYQDLFQGFTVKGFEQHGIQVKVDKILCLFNISLSADEDDRVLVSSRPELFQPFQA